MQPHQSAAAIRDESGSPQRLVNQGYMEAVLRQAKPVHMEMIIRRMTHTSARAGGHLAVTTIASPRPSGLRHHTADRKLHHRLAIRARHEP